MGTSQSLMLGRQVSVLGLKGKSFCTSDLTLAKAPRAGIIPAPEKGGRGPEKLSGLARYVQGWELAGEEW